MRMMSDNEQLSGAFYTIKFHIPVEKYNEFMSISDSTTLWAWMVEEEAYMKDIFRQDFDLKIDELKEESH